MFYALAAPAAQYAADRQTLLAVLKSFRSSASASTPAANLSMEPFREPTEGAYQSVKPSGWQVAGGVRRISNNDVRVGIQLLSPDRAAAIWLGDVRLNKCVVLGANMRQFGSSPLGAGSEYCPYRDGIQTAEFHALRALSDDRRLEGLLPPGTPRPLPKLVHPGMPRYRENPRQNRLRRPIRMPRLVQPNPTLLRQIIGPLVFAQAAGR